MTCNPMLRQENSVRKTSLGYIAKPCLKNTEKRKKKKQTSLSLSLVWWLSVAVTKYLRKST
jgi:hypothetical protein